MERAAKFSLKEFIIRYNAVLILAVLFIVSSLFSPVFLTSRNIFNLLRQNVPAFLISMGMLLVILTGGIDLSVGSIVAMGCMMISMTMLNWGWDSPPMLVIDILLSLMVGGLFGAISGFLIAYLKMAAFVVTLAMMTIVRGCAYLVTNGIPVSWGSGRPAVDFLTEFGSGKLLGIPYPVVLAAVVFVIFVVLTKYMTFGRMVIATGSNEDAVRLSGVNAKKYHVYVYAISGVLSALAGIVMSCRSGTGTPVSGEGYELDAIAACVIGGASLSGGQGTVSNTLIGVLILALITNIMNLMSIAAYPQKVIKGIIIILAVFMQSMSNRARKDA